MIDWNIRAGDLLVVASLGISAFGYAVKSGRTAQVIEGMQKQLEELKGVVTTLAVQKERMDSMSTRMNTLDKRVEDLRWGRGYVDANSREAKSIDREY